MDAEELACRMNKKAAQGHKRVYSGSRLTERRAGARRGIFCNSLTAVRRGRSAYIQATKKLTGSRAYRGGKAGQYRPGKTALNPVECEGQSGI
jgi:hypothetical protein